MVVVCVISMLVWVELVIEIMFICGCEDMVVFILGLLLLIRLKMLVGMFVLCMILVNSKVDSGDSLFGFNIMV